MVHVSFVNATIEWVPTCASTQVLAHERLASGEVAPGCIFAVVADSQRAGRGRDGRMWQDPPGAALLMSLAIRGPFRVEVLEELPRILASAVRDGIDPTGADPGVIEWKAPNDLVAAAGGAKVGGVLIDARTTAAVVDFLVLGIGVNLDGGSFTTADGRAATSVAALSGTAPDRRTIVDHLVAWAIELSERR